MARHIEVTAAPASAVGRTGVVATGAMHGLVAGVGMGVVLIVAAAYAKTPALHPFMAIGATFVGPEALEGGTGVAMYGAALHLLLSGLLGVGFVALIPPDMPRVSAIGVGVGYAFLVLGIMASLVVPPVNSVFRAEMQHIGGSWVIAHGVFGAMLGSLGGASPERG
jgi:hypothetical protein